MPSPMMNTLVRDHPRLNVPACQASRMRSRKLEGNAPPLTNRKTQRRTVKTATPVFFAAFDTDSPLPISLMKSRMAIRVRSWMNCVASWAILSKRMSKEADPMFTCYQKGKMVTEWPDTPPNCVKCVQFCDGLMSLMKRRRTLTILGSVPTA